MKRTITLFLALFVLSCGGDGPDKPSPMPGNATPTATLTPQTGDPVLIASRQPQGHLAVAENPQRLTPKGAVVHGQGVEQLSGSALNLIDAGIDDALRDAAPLGNKHAASSGHTFYHFYLPTGGCQLSPVSKTPSFLVRGDNYDGLCDGSGNTFDQYNPQGPCVKDGIGVVYAPEMVLDLGVGRTHSRSAICPFENAIRTFARYAVEHIKIRHEDLAYYQATETHGPPHPLLPKPTMQALRSRTYPEWAGLAR